MCLYIKDWDWTNSSINKPVNSLGVSLIRTADKPIVCYKRLMYYGHLSSPFITEYFDEVYKLNQTKKVDEFGIHREKVYEGLHAYTHLKNIPKHCRTIIKCIIPKGTKYILGDNGDIVALKLKVVKAIRGRCKQFNEAGKNRTKRK